MRIHRLVILLFPLLIVTACSGRQRVRRDVPVGRETFEVMMPTGAEIAHPVHGKEVWFAVGAMSGEGKAKANGVAQSHVFADGTTIATVNLNIEPAPKGMKYVAWLGKPGSLERARLDALQNPLGDVRHVITGEVDRDLRTSIEVIVTLEGPGGPLESDPVVARGTLKERQR